MELSVCRRLGLCVAAWSIAGVLAVLDTLGGPGPFVFRSWILVSLSIAITMSISLMVWRLEVVLHRDIVGGDQGTEDGLRLVN